VEQKRLKTNIVPAVGPLDAEICFVGEAPGEEEDRMCEPFVGSAGSLLNRSFQREGIIRSQVLLTNVFCQRPPRNNLDYFYQDKMHRLLTWEGQEHVERLKAWLEERLAERTACGKGINLLVALGAEPMKILTGKERITKWRGSLLPCTLVPGFKVYPTFHPSYVNRLINEPREALQGAKKQLMQNVLPLFLIDLRRILSQGKDKGYEIPQREFKTNLSYTEILAHLDMLLRDKPRLCAVDIETLPGLNGPLVWCIGFAPSPAWSFCVPFIRRQSFAWGIEEEAELWVRISKVFLEPSIKKIFQGGNYDLSVLGKYYGIRCANKSYGDTMLKHHAVYPYIKKGLEVLASIYTWEPYYKDEGKINLGKRTDESEFAYNGKDCCVTREIYPTVTKDASEHGVLEGYDRTIGVMPSLLGMQIRGVKLDVGRKEELGRIFEERAGQAQELVCKRTGEVYNLNAVKDKQKLLYGFLGLPFQYHPKTGKVTTDKDALQKLKKKAPKEELLQAVLDYQRFNKLATAFTSMKADEDGRVHTSYSFVSTWRLSSSQSHFGSPFKGEAEGGNLQNIPKKGDEGAEIRKLFIPDEGYEMGKGDGSQAEARVVAYEAEDLQRIELFDKGWDVHWYNARLIFGVPKEVPYNPKALFKDYITRNDHTLKELRNIGKTVVHAGNYGLGPRMLQTILSREEVFVEYKVCVKMLEQHEARNPMLLEWHRRIRDQLRIKRELVSSFGRKRQFLGRFNEQLFNAAYAFSPQNTVGEWLQQWIKRVWEGVPKAQILLNVHDEIVWQHLPENRDEVMKAVSNCSKIPIRIKGRDLIIPVELSYGRSWGEMEEYKI